MKYSPEITVDKIADTTKNAKAKDKIIYIINIKNTGHLTLNAVDVIDILSTADGDKKLTLYTDTNFTVGNEVTSIDKIDVGQTVTLYTNYTVTQDDIDKQEELVNTVTASDGNITGTDTATTTLEVANPEIKVQKDANITENAKEGDIIIYTIKLENLGNVTLKNIDIIDKILTSNGEENLTLYTDENCTAGNEVASIDKIDVGQSLTLYAKYTVTNNDTKNLDKIENTVTATVQDISESDKAETTLLKPVETPDAIMPQTGGKGATLYIVAGIVLIALGFALTRIKVKKN